MNANPTTLRAPVAVVALFSILVTACGLSESDRPKTPRMTRAAAEAANAFAIDLYTHLRKNEGNIFFSPYSIHSALAMTCAGARGKTEKEMAGVLHVAPGAESHSSAGALLQELNAAKDRGLDLVVANALWGQEGFAFLDGYLATVRKFYGAELRHLDFVRNAEQARRTINAWIARQTRDKIRDLLPPGTIDRLTRLVLTNAAYFKAAWTHPFKEDATHDAPFTLPDGRRVNVPMMRQQHRFGYMEDDDLQALSMPYGRGAASMLVLLPRDAAGLADLEAALAAEKLRQVLEKMRSRPVRVFLPRFECTSQFRLKEALSALGMSSAFDAGRADFSGMTGRRDLFISAVVHKAYVKVNEEGTEAAAATGVVMGLTAARPQEPVTFRADHPFLFLIRHNRSGAILFMGRCADPAGMD